jgi:signal transduction histidine kinase
MGPVCRRCYREVRGNPAPCAGCGATKPLIGADFRGRGVCGACAGGRFDYVCRRCGGGEERYQDGHCVRCVAIERLHEQFRGPDGVVPDVLVPLVVALAQADRPRSAMEWLRRDNGGARVLRQLGAAGVEPTHEVLDSLPPNAVNALRQMLVHVGALPARIEYLERVPAWLNRQLPLLPEHHRQVIHVYATWTLLRRARQRAAHTRFTEASAHNLRARVTVAIAFLRWLDEQHVALADVTQALADQWLSEGACTRRVVKRFLDWTASRGLAPELDVRYLPDSEPDLSVTNEERWELLRRCLHDATLPLDVRAAGGLVLLYGFPVSRISELTAQHVISTDDGHVLQLGGHRTALPPALAALLTDLARTAVTTSAVGRSVPGPRWLFPGALPGQHFTPGRLTAMLNRHGIRVRRGRNSALAALAADIPAAALSPLLGIGIEAAVRWTHRAKRDWHAYIQARATPPTAPDQHSDGPDRQSADTGQHAAPASAGPARDAAG